MGASSPHYAVRKGGGDMTIKDIARMAGVSVSTVSRVLNHHPDVSAPIRAQVLKVVE